MQISVEVGFIHYLCSAGLGGIVSLRTANVYSRCGTFPGSDILGPFAGGMGKGEDETFFLTRSVPW